MGARPGIIPSIFFIFTSEKHARILSEKENAVIVGSAIDELIRHHPSLKDSVFSAITSVFKRIEDLGSTFAEEKGTENFYRLVLTIDSSRKDIKMESGDNAPVPSSSSSSEVPETENEAGKAETVENSIVLYIDVVCRVSPSY